MTDEKTQPFWIQQPYLVLFDLLKLHRLKPWDIDIAQLLNSFLQEMNARGLIDFSASGTALLSSAILHRMKSELLLKMEEPPRQPTVKPDESVPPPLPFPLRYQFTSTSIEEVLSALEEALRSEKLILDKRVPVLRPPEILEVFDEFLSNIEKHIEELYRRLTIEGLGLKEISFLRMVRGMSGMEIVRAFIVLLFLANQRRISLEQREERGDLVITKA